MFAMLIQSIAIFFLDKLPNEAQIEKITTEKAIKSEIKETSKISP